MVWVLMKYSREYSSWVAPPYFIKWKELKKNLKTKFLTVFNYWGNVNLFQKLYKINAENENQTQIILKNEDTQVVFTVECLKNRQISKNPCAKNNGQCQQLCITSKISKENYTCACKIGYELSSDGKSCFPVQEFILYTLVSGINVVVTLNYFLL